MNELGNTPADKNYKPSGISKAESRAWEAYPYENGMKGLICENSRGIYIQGYEQAEKDVKDTLTEWLKQGFDWVKNPVISVQQIIDKLNSM